MESLGECRTSAKSEVKIIYDVQLPVTILSKTIGMKLDRYQIESLLLSGKTVEDGDIQFLLRAVVVNFQPQLRPPRTKREKRKRARRPSCLNIA